MREGFAERQTTETSVRVRVALDGTGQCRAATGIGFLDHMLALLARHGLLDLEVEARGDLHVDCHHTVEDTGIVLGQALAHAWGDKAGLRRYGCAHIPMDEALARVVVDLSGRPMLVFDAPPSVEPILPGFSFFLVEEFLRALASQAALTLHVALLAGRNSHHMAEAVFKGLGRALNEATNLEPRSAGVPSTKGVL